MTTKTEYNREPVVDAAALLIKSFRSGILVFSLNFLEKGLTFVQALVLARLLLPEYFGLIGICWLVIGTFETFSETGFKIALLQKKENIEPYLSTAWIIQFLRGITLYALVYFTAPLIETFFNTKGSTEVLRVLGITLLISSVTNIGMITYIREINFKKQFLHNISGTVVDVAVSITLAFYFRNVWAFVWGNLAGMLVRVLISYVLHPFRPSLNFNRERARELFHFGKWVSASTIIIFLITNGDNAFVGKYLGIVALGFYQMAYKISNLPATEITHVVSQVTLPLYSKLQHDKPGLMSIYQRVLDLVMFTSIPAAGLICVLASDFTKLFLGNTWLPMVPALQILTLFGVIRALNATAGPLFQAFGNPSILSRVSLLQLIFVAILIYPLTSQYHLVGVCLSVTIPNIFCFFLTFREIPKIINKSLRKILRPALLPILIAFIITAVISIFKFFTRDNLPLSLSFLFSILFGVSIYALYLKHLGLFSIAYKRLPAINE